MIEFFKKIINGKLISILDALDILYVKRDSSIDSIEWPGISNIERVFSSLLILVEEEHIKLYGRRCKIGVSTSNKKTKFEEIPRDIIFPYFSIDLKGRLLQNVASWSDEYISIFSNEKEVLYTDICVRERELINSLKPVRVSYGLSLKFRRLIILSRIRYCWNNLIRFIKDKC